eukprot:TRINITY_DN52052_c0_g1_i1.p1 TRINITY_DN52052_c0_g1~~TRINITY_DN52052_c0_g1_i1.p1  ORF type:complete len:135 (-),score=30.70 TRINITY_DN52052_c0_g1_i1:171-575(-)
MSRTLCILLVSICLYFFFFFQAEDGIRDAQESRGLGDVYKRQGKNEPFITPYFERKQREVEAQMQANEERRKELGLSNSLQSDPQAGKATAVSYRGRPFTPEGLAAARRDRKGGMIPVPPPTNVGDDIECDMDD